MSFTDWMKPVKALTPAQPTPVPPSITPAQVITGALTANTSATQGELLDACKAKGLVINYNGLQMVLRSLQMSGVIVSRFTPLDSALPVLVYQRRH